MHHNRLRSTSRHDKTCKTAKQSLHKPRLGKRSQLPKGLKKRLVNHSKVLSKPHNNSKISNKLKYTSSLGDYRVHQMISYLDNSLVKMASSLILSPSHSNTMHKLAKNLFYLTHQNTTAAQPLLFPLSPSSSSSSSSSLSSLPKTKGQSVVNMINSMKILQSSSLISLSTSSSLIQSPLIQSSILQHNINSISKLSSISSHVFTRTLPRYQTNAKPFNFSARIPPEVPEPISVTWDKEHSNALTLKKLTDKHGIIGLYYYLVVAAFSMGLFYLMMGIFPSTDPFHISNWIGRREFLQWGGLGRRFHETVCNSPQVSKFIMAYIYTRLAEPVRMATAIALSQYLRSSDAFFTSQYKNILEKEQSFEAREKKISLLLDYMENDYHKHDQYQSLSIHELFDLRHIDILPDLNTDEVRPTPPSRLRSSEWYIGPKATTNQMITIFNRTGLPVGTLAKEGTTPIIKQYVDQKSQRIEYIIVRMVRSDGSEIESIRSKSKNRTSVHIWTKPDPTTGESYQRTDERFPDDSFGGIKKKTKRQFLFKHGRWGTMGYTEGRFIPEEIQAAYEDFHQPVTLPQDMYDEDDIEWYKYHRFPALNYGGTEKSVNPIEWQRLEEENKEKERLKKIRASKHPFQLSLENDPGEEAIDAIDGRSIDLWTGSRSGYVKRVIGKNEIETSEAAATFTRLIGVQLAYHRTEPTEEDKKKIEEENRLVFNNPDVRYIEAPDGTMIPTDVRRPELYKTDQTEQEKNRLAYDEIIYDSNDPVKSFFKSTGPKQPDVHYDPKVSQIEENDYTKIARQIGLVSPVEEAFNAQDEKSKVDNILNAEDIATPADTYKEPEQQKLYTLRDGVLEVNVNIVKDQPSEWRRKKKLLEESYNVDVTKKAFEDTLDPSLTRKVVTRTILARDNSVVPEGTVIFVPKTGDKVIDNNPFWDPPESFKSPEPEPREYMSDNMDTQYPPKPKDNKDKDNNNNNGNKDKQKSPFDSKYDPEIDKTPGLRQYVEKIVKKEEERLDNLKPGQTSDDIPDGSPNQPVDLYTYSFQYRDKLVTKIFPETAPEEVQNDPDIVLLQLLLSFDKLPMEKREQIKAIVTDMLASDYMTKTSQLGDGSLSDQEDDDKKKNKKKQNDNPDDELTERHNEIKEIISSFYENFNDSNSASSWFTFAEKNLPPEVGLLRKKYQNEGFSQNEVYEKTSPEPNNAFLYYPLMVQFAEKNGWTEILRKLRSISHSEILGIMSHEARNVATDDGSLDDEFSPENVARELRASLGFDNEKILTWEDDVNDVTKRDRTKLSIQQDYRRLVKQHLDRLMLEISQKEIKPLINETEKPNLDEPVPDYFKDPNLYKFKSWKGKVLPWYDADAKGLPLDKTKYTHAFVQSKKKPDQPPYLVWILNPLWRPKGWTGPKAEMPRMSIWSNPMVRRLVADSRIPYDNNFYERQEAARGTYMLWTNEVIRKHGTKITTMEQAEAVSDDLDKLRQVNRFIQQQQRRVLQRNHYLNFRRGVDYLRRAMYRDFAEYSFKTQQYERHMKVYQRHHDAYQLRQKALHPTFSAKDISADIIPKVEPIPTRAFDPHYVYP